MQIGSIKSGADPPHRVTELGQSVATADDFYALAMSRGVSNR